MSVSYAPVKVQIPPGFEVILQDLAREVLRSQPDDIIGFAAEYFKKKLTQRKGELGVIWGRIHHKSYPRTHNDCCVYDHVVMATFVGVH